MQFFSRLLWFKKRVISLHLFPLLLTLSLSAIDVQGAGQPVILGTEGNISISKRYPLSDEQYYSPNPYAQKRITAISAIVIDPVRDLTLFAKAPDVPRQPASTIKVLTGTIALEALSGEETVSISKNAASRPSSKMYLDPKKEYLADDLISGVLLASANDASVAIAELISGSEENFTKLMNRLARDWGATNTDCRTATGLTAKNQKSTSRDLALIFKHAMQSEEFSERIKRRAMQTVDGEKFYNHNKALWQIKGALGGKTGFTQAARQTYVGMFKRGEAEIIVALMGSSTMWNDLKYLVQYGFKQYQYIPDAKTRELLAKSDKKTSKPVM